MRTRTNSCCVARWNLVYRSDRRQDKANCSATYCSATTDSKVDSQNNSIQNKFSCDRIKISQPVETDAQAMSIQIQFRTFTWPPGAKPPQEPKSHIETQLFCMPIAHKPNTKTANTHVRQPHSHGTARKSTRVLSKSKASFLSLFPQVSIDIDNFASPAKNWP